MLNVLFKYIFFTYYTFLLTIITLNIVYKDDYHFCVLLFTLLYSFYISLYFLVVISYIRIQYIAGLIPYRNDEIKLLEFDECKVYAAPDLGHSLYSVYYN